MAVWIEKGESKTERQLAEEEKLLQKAERYESSQWRVRQTEENKVSTVMYIINCLSPAAIQDDTECLRSTKATCLEGTLTWLPDTPEVKDWLSDDASNTCVWVTASPGIGKTTCCAYMVDKTSCQPERRLVAYHFYRYNQHYTTMEIFRSLAQQLFQQLCDVGSHDTEAIRSIAQTNKEDPEMIVRLIRSFIERSPSVVFFLDGLDEVYKTKDAVATVVTLLKLCEDYSDKVRLWCSSQYHPVIARLLKSAQRLNLDHRTEGDLDIFFNHAFGDLADYEISDGERKAMLQTLREKAKGNLLLASLMKNDLIEYTNSIVEMREFVDGSIPQHLNGRDGNYARIFERIEDSQKHLASLVFSLICFAKRPLRIDELRDAIAILSSRDTKVLDVNARPLTDTIRKICSPLIKIDTNREGLAVCQVVHSTVIIYLEKHPDILQKHNSISPERVISIRPLALACLRYLTQDVYKSLLLKQNGRWHTKGGRPIFTQSFLAYAAKYWNTHLDMANNSQELFNEVDAFVRSSNFWTCIQIRSLFVQGQFDLYSGSGALVKSQWRRDVFPLWYAFDPSVKPTWRAYRSFVHEWGPFLSRGVCIHDECDDKCHAGEIDRCFPSGLASEELSSRLGQRYRNICFSKGAISLELPHFESIGDDGKTLTLVQLKLQSRSGDAQFLVKQWKIERTRDICLASTQSVMTDMLISEWRWYTRGARGQRTKYSDRISPLSQSSDGRAIRIGRLMFISAQESGLQLLQTADDCLSTVYIEDIEKKDHILVISSRKKIEGALSIRTTLTGQSKAEAERTTELPSVEELLYESSEEAKEAPELTGTPEEHSEEERYDVEKTSASSASELSPSESSAPESDPAVESWSEGSTVEDEIDEDQAPLYPWDASDDQAPKTNSSAAHSDSDSDSPEASSDDGRRLAARAIWGDEDSDRSSREDDHEEFPPSLSNDGGDTLDFDSDEAPNALFTQDFRTKFRTVIRAKQKRDKAAKKENSAATLLIYDSSTKPSKRLFRFQQEIKATLHDSPPTVHPTAPLLVWPLGDSEILFADYEGGTYFTRTLHLSASRSRHLSIQPHFSSDGKYLHIAALEARRAWPPKKTKRKASKRKAEAQTIPDQTKVGDQVEAPLTLHMLVSTYRLSESRTARSPPRLIHRTKVHLGQRRELSVTQLPLTLTWAKDDLYICCSDAWLNIYRVKLLPDQQAPGSIALVPRKVIFLPNSARHRRVYYFPPKDGGLHAHIIVGAEASSQRSNGKAPRGSEVVNSDQVIRLEGALASTTGIFISEQEDLGGWVLSEEIAEIPMDMGVGALDQKVEIFDNDDDCDVEHCVC